MPVSRAGALFGDTKTCRETQLAKAAQRLKTALLALQVVGLSALTKLERRSSSGSPSGASTPGITTWFTDSQLGPVQWFTWCLPSVTANARGRICAPTSWCTRTDSSAAPAGPPSGRSSTSHLHRGRVPQAASSSWRTSCQQSTQTQKNRVVVIYLMC